MNWWWNILSWLGVEVETLSHEEAMSIVLNHHIEDISCEWFEDPDELF